jgi:hypothetical protein
MCDTIDVAGSSIAVSSDDAFSQGKITRDREVKSESDKLLFTDL